LRAVEGLLQDLPGVVNVRFSDAGPSSPTDLGTWERRHGMLLPDDLREFYMVRNGMACRWDVIAHGREVVPLGCMAVNALDELVPVDSTALLDERDEMRPELPAAGQGGPLRAFDLDSTCECGRVLLLLGCAGAPRRAEVWFQDVSCGLTQLAGSFAEYMRLLTVSLGLPRWHYAHTEAGLDPTSRQWFRLLAPHQLAASEHDDDDRAAAATLHAGSGRAPPKRAPPSHSAALALLQRANGMGPQASGPPVVAAGAPREAVALLNAGAGPLVARPASAGARPASTGVARPTGEAAGGRRHRALRTVTRVGSASCKRGVGSHMQEPPPEE